MVTYNIKRVLSAALITVLAISTVSCTKKPQETAAGKTAENNKQQTDNTNAQSNTSTQLGDNSDINGDLYTLISSHDGYSVTPEISEKLFDVARKYRFDDIFRFDFSSENEQQPLLDMMYYTMVFDNCKYMQRDSEGKSFVYGKDINAVAEQYFGFKYDIADDDKVYPPKIESLNGAPIIDFVRYKVEDTAEGKKVTVVGRNLSVFSMFYSSHDEQLKEELSPYEHDYKSTDDPPDCKNAVGYMLKHNLTNKLAALKEIITTGQGEIIYGKGNTGIRLTYLSDDGFTPKKYLSVEKYDTGCKPAELVEY